MQLDKEEMKRMAGEAKKKINWSQECRVGSPVPDNVSDCSEFHKKCTAERQEVEEDQESLGGSQYSGNSYRDRAILKPIVEPRYFSSGESHQPSANDEEEKELVYGPQRPRASGFDDEWKSDEDSVEQEQADPMAENNAGTQ